MTERKLTDEEVITELQSASEWFAEHGRNTNTAIIGICDRAVDLINRQKEQIEELRKGFKADADYFANEYDSYIRAEAIKEFADEFKKRCLASGIYPVVTKNILKNLVKEKTEGQE